MQKLQIYTDLAIEAHETRTDVALLTSPNVSQDFEGVEVSTDESDDILITTVEVKDEKGAERIGKPIGTYITIESQALKDNDVCTHEKIIEILSQTIGKLHNLNKDDSVLIVGLGNWQVTPDALGPKTVSKLLVTRHIAQKKILPDEIENNVRSVAAVSPGVLGLTGIETSEIVKGIVDKIQPKLIIAIDALAARKTSRINTTIQISNTGVTPGGGIGNKRKALNEENLGVPVIAIGVPTVVDAATLTNDTINRILDDMLRQTQQGSDFYNTLKNLQDEEKYNLIAEILNPYQNMFVTPKEVDAVIERLSNIIGNALNISLHPGIDTDDINRYLY